MSLEVKRMWPDGPLREFAQQRPKNAGSNWISQAGGGFAGASWPPAVRFLTRADCATDSN